MTRATIARTDLIVTGEAANEVQRNESKSDEGKHQGVMSDEETSDWNSTGNMKRGERKGHFGHVAIGKLQRKRNAAAGLMKTTLGEYATSRHAKHPVASNEILAISRARSCVHALPIRFNIRW